MHEVYARFQENEQLRIVEEEKLAILRQQEDARLALEKAKQLAKEVKERDEAALFVSSFGTPKDQEVGAHVRKLQQTLKLLGYFSGKDTAIFGKITRNALAQYQIDRKIITKLDRSEAGIIGEKTRLALTEDLLNIKKIKNAVIALK